MKIAPLCCIDCSEGVLLLIQKYELCYQNRLVGFVKLTKSGRFYKISCRFQPQSNRVLHLFAIDGEKETDLGVCSAYSDGFGLDRWLPMGHIGETLVGFALRQEGDFMPISNTQPFMHIDRLETGRFTIREGVKGIILQL